MTPRFGLPAELAELAREYEIVDELGRGGSAIVYRARDLALGRDVAIKVVHPRPTSPDDDPVARLAREARTVAQLHHPGIVSVYAVRRLQSGGLALVMQLVPGATLKALIQREGPLAVRRAEAVLRDVAHALAYAHARQVVHRDVKPENIFLDAESGRALLADFGIARSGEADSLTLTGTAIGTPFYMSPEQVDGAPVDGRSDLYSLGLVAWEMLTGQRPWDGESLYHVIYKQKHGTLPPIEAHRADVPRRLQYIVERMLQKEPAARWAGADGLLAQLDRTILPADYGRWQAALPGRIARHFAEATAPRAPAARMGGAGAAGAATIRFTAPGDALPSPGGGHSAEVRAAYDLEATQSFGRHASGADDHATPATPGMPLGKSDALGFGTRVDADDRTSPDHVVAPAPEYDSVTPEWESDAPSAALGPARPWKRHALHGSAVTAVVLAAVVAMQVRGVFAASAPAYAESGFARSTSRLLVRPTSPTVSGEVAAPTRGAADVVVARAAVARAERVAVGAHHTCRIVTKGGVECWERDGPATPAGVSRQTELGVRHAIAGVMRYASLGAGASHTCAVTPAGDVYCWGANAHGQLGDGTTVPRSAPVRVGGPGVYATVWGGFAHTCGIETGGRVQCWGANDLGQLGDGTRIARPIPTAVHLPDAIRSTAVAVGAEHSCALARDGRVFCWGSNTDGQLGVAGRAERDEPREVPGVRAHAISAGDAHTCAVIDGGAVRCWGRDDAGQLGVIASRTDATALEPGRLTVVPGGENVQRVAAGAAHTCALTTGGRLWCWGGTRGKPNRAPVQIGVGPYVAVAAAGGRTCALAGVDAGVPECWAADSGAPRALSVAARTTVTSDGEVAAPHARSRLRTAATRTHHERPHASHKRSRKRGRR